MIELVGEGTHSRVYIADDLTLRRRVALKVLGGELVSSDQFKRRFAREMKVAEGLRFPRVLPIYDWGTDPVPYVVSEHLEGGSLADILAAGRRLSASQALSIGLEVARALVNIHRSGSAYRGLTTRSILFDSRARVFVADIGVAGAMSMTDSADHVESAGEPADAKQSGRSLDAAAGAGAGSGSSVSGKQSGATGDQGSGETEGSWAGDSESLDTEAWELEEWAPLESGASEKTPPGTDQGAQAAQAAEATEAAAQRLAADQAADVHDLAMIVVEAVMGTRIPPAEMVDATSPGFLLLGPMANGLLRATSPPAGSEALDASGFIDELLSAARLLPRPDEIPLATSDHFSASARDFSLVSPASAPGQLAAQRSHAPLDDVPKRRWPGLLLAVVVVLGGAAGGAWAWLNSQTDAPVVPELVGGTTTEATAAADPHGWAISEVLVRQEETQRGEVVATTPAAGAELGEGETLRVFVSLGEPLVPLDFDVYGYTVTEASSSLGERGLVMSTTTAVASESLPEGLVVGLDISDGVYELAAGSEVGLLVSQGPPDRQVPAVPAERTPLAAVDALFGARLDPREVAEFSDQVPEGEVIGFRPPSGTSVAVNTPVDVVVSLGPEPLPEDEEAEDGEGTTAEESDDSSG